MTAIRVAVAGASGRMGRTLIRALAEAEDMRLAFALELPGHAELGKDAGVLAGLPATGIALSDDPLVALAASDAVLDFTAPAASVPLAELAAQARIVHVIGTTGFSEADLVRLNAAARHAVIVKSGNMSLGVNLLSALQLIGAVTPQMRAQGGGRIINLGSVAGFVPAPLAIPYAATKIGLHAATDALRLELGRFGITLSLVIPGFVDTAVFDNARNASQALREDLNNPYRQTMFDLDELAMKNLEHSLSPDDVAKVIVKAATARRPKPRYYTPRSTLIQKVLLGMLPARGLDAILSRVYKLPRKKAQPRPPASPQA